VSGPCLLGPSASCFIDLCCQQCMTYFFSFHIYIYIYIYCMIPCPLFLNYLVKLKAKISLSLTKFEVPFVSIAYYFSNASRYWHSFLLGGCIIVFTRYDTCFFLVFWSVCWRLVIALKHPIYAQLALFFFFFEEEEEGMRIKRESNKEYVCFHAWPS